MFKKLSKFLPILIFLLVFSIGCEKGSDSSNDWVWEEHPELGTGSVVFSYVPITYEAFYEFWPMGHINLPEHPIPTMGGGFQFTPQTKKSPVDVRSPADGVITWIRKLVVEQNGVTYEDYALRIYHTNTFVSFLDHLSSIDESVMKKLRSLNIGENKVYVRVNAGDVIAKTGVNIEGLGWYLYNREANLDYINKAKYGPYNPYSVFPLDYFPDAEKTNLYSYIKRTKNPRSGKCDFDIKGTLSGNWIVKGGDPIAKPQPWSVWLSFCYDMFDPDYRRVSIGQDLGKMIGKPDGVLTSPKSGPEYTSVTKNSGKVVYKLFDVSEGEEFNIGHPYDDTIKYTLLVEMQSDDEIKVELFNGDIASPEFTSNAMFYTR